MTDIVEQLRTHDDARLYAEADLLMAEAADEIEARDAEIERNREAIAELVEALKEIRTRLRSAGASIPAPENKGTIESAIAMGMSLGLLLVDDAITKHTTTKGN